MFIYSLFSESCVSDNGMVIWKEHNTIVLATRMSTHFITLVTSSVVLVN